jgi:hypothetical protein
MGILPHPDSRAAVAKQESARCGGRGNGAPLCVLEKVRAVFPANRDRGSDRLCQRVTPGASEDIARRWRWRCFWVASRRVLPAARITHLSDARGYPRHRPVPQPLHHLRARRRCRPPAPRPFPRPMQHSAPAPASLPVLQRPLRPHTAFRPPRGRSATPQPYPAPSVHLHRPQT